MYNEQLEKLIDAALSDGQLTEKEKQILFKRAESMGIELDEFEMVLESRLFEKGKQSAPASPQSDKFGDIRKCPACGALAESFATKCSDCGTEFRNIQASQNIIKFFEKLDELERTRTDSPSQESSNSNIGVGTILKWLFFYWILLPLKAINFILNKTKTGKWSTTDVRKEELIMNFPVPNSREEIFEFLTLSLSKIDVISYTEVVSEKGKYRSAWNAVWLKKLEQINTKATLAMKNDKKSLDDIASLVSEGRSKVNGNTQRVYHLIIGFVAIITILIVIARTKGN
jgi:DnaJ-domain-containing protein 1